MSVWIFTGKQMDKLETSKNWSRSFLEVKIMIKMRHMKIIGMIVSCNFSFVEEVIIF